MIAVDWGTTSFRAYLVDEAGTVRDQRRSGDGMSSVEGGRFSDVLDRHIGEWLSRGAGPVVMCGMIGARQGWQEVPYVRCPAGVAEIAAGLRRVTWGEGREAWVAPGVSVRDVTGIPDVMRGEETQVIGSLAALETPPEWLCLPGTHSKWVRVTHGRIVDFTTHMTGEWFAMAKAHSLLGRMMVDGPTNVEAFDAGVRRAGEPGGLLHHAFGVRTLGLFGELESTAAASYLSGLLIGHELESIPDVRGPVALIGNTALTDLYTRALARHNFESVVLPPDIVVRGLARLAPFVRASA